MDKYVIMPNHIHIIIILNGVQNQGKIFQNQGTPGAASPTKAMIPKVINRLKGLTTRKLGYSIWQRSYHEEIIKNQEHYKNVSNYINANPQNWQKNEHYNKN